MAFAWIGYNIEPVAFTGVSKDDNLFIGIHLAVWHNVSIYLCTCKLLTLRIFTNDTDHEKQSSYDDF